MHFKQREITEYIKDYLYDNESYLKNNNYDLHDLHHAMFNTDYYLYGYSDCEIWLSGHVFECIGIIKDYEQDNFGEVFTDLTCSEQVVSKYVYIIGEELLYNMEEKLKKRGLISCKTS